MRQLTTKFGTYKLGKYEKSTGKSVMDLIDIGNFEINKIALLISLGNPQMQNEEEAYQRLDDYLSYDSEHSLITAFFDLIDEMDRDLKILKSCGVSVKAIKEQFKNEINKQVEKSGITDETKITELVNKVDEPVVENNKQ